MTFLVSYHHVNSFLHCLNAFLVLIIHHVKNVMQIISQKLLIFISIVIIIYYLVVLFILHILLSDEFWNAIKATSIFGMSIIISEYRLYLILSDSGGRSDRISELRLSVYGRELGEILSGNSRWVLLYDFHLSDRD